MRRVLYVVVCAAAPAPYADRLVALARDKGWDVWVIATPSARAFADFDALQEASGHPVRDSYRDPGSTDPGMPPADAVIVAPASMNTIGKWANGISDTLATGILGEAFGFDATMVVLPFVSDAQATNPAYRRNTQLLMDAGVRFPCGISRPSRVREFPWETALGELD